MFIKTSGYYVSNNLDELTIFIRGILLTSKDIENYINVDDIVAKIVKADYDFNPTFNYNMQEYGFKTFYAIRESDIKYIIALCKVSIGNE